MMNYNMTKNTIFFDRKSARIKPLDILKHLVGFANASGGKLVIGIEDNGDITGFKSNNAGNVEDFKNALLRLKETPIIPKYTEIQVKNKFDQDDVVLIIDVEASANRVIKSYNNDVYLRYGDKTEKLNHEQITQLEYDKGQRSFEDEVVEDSSISDIDLDIIEQYKKNMDISCSAEEILEARNMLKKGKITNAGVLLFSKNPTKYLPQARLKFIKYDGVKAEVGRSINIIKEKTFDGAIPKVIIESTEFIRTQFREFQYLDTDGKFKKMPEYPEFAWFEGIVNAVTHRNYAIIGDYIKVIMFDDRLEIHSPGLLPNIVTIENIRERRYSRNPRIARILSEFGWVKEMNEGVKRIYNEMEKYFLKSPQYYEPCDSLLLVLENNILNRRLRIDDSITELVQSGDYQTLSETEKMIVKYAFMNKKVMVKEVANLIEKSLVTARKQLKLLQEKGILDWYGTNSKDPQQYYFLRK